jgi:hypothetical protein
MCKKLNNYGCNNKQHKNIQSLNIDLLWKTLSREKPNTPKNTHCIIQQLKNGYNTLQSLHDLNRSVQQHKGSIKNLVAW